MHVTFEKYKLRYQLLRAITDLGRKLKLVWSYLSEDEKEEILTKYKNCQASSEDFEWLKKWIISKRKIK